MNTAVVSLSRAELELRIFMTRVYGWMSAALFITAVVAMLAAASPTLAPAIAGNNLLFFGLIIGELALVVYLTAAIGKMSVGAATGAFIGFAVLNGLILSIIFLVFTRESIASTFFVTAGTFGIMSAYGYFTKKDLTSVGNLCYMALIGVIIASIVNIFFFNKLFYWVITYIGIFVFIGLTAYDTQKIKQMAAGGTRGGQDFYQKGAIIGALRLYLDFINLFLLLLRIFGRRR